MVPRPFGAGNVRHGPEWAVRLALVLAFSAGASWPLAAQTAPAADAYADQGVRALLERARAARERDIEGIRSYEAELRERVYVGLSAARFRRERGLFEQERIARLRWSAEGERAIHWLGARRAVPIIGADTRRDNARDDSRSGRAAAEAQADLGDELEGELLRDTDLPAFSFDPGADRLVFGGGDWALHPLADSAVDHYRFRSGDTLRIHLPPDRDVVLYEVRVEPRRADFHLVAGSLWFDRETASLVRASYRPARAFNLLLDEPEDAEDVPGFLQPIEAEISYITVEYSLQEFRYWLPRRFAMEGEARLGRVVRIPLTVEWSVRDYRVNEASSSIAITGPLPPGWSRREVRTEDDKGRVSYVTVVVPERDSVLSSPLLSEDFGRRAPGAFTDQEVDELRGDLQALLPTYRRFQPTLSWGLTQGLVRFNRVEGLSMGASASLPLATVTELAAEARIGTGDREPYGSLAITHGAEARSWSLEAYRRLVPMGDWTHPFTFGASLEALVFGNAPTQFHRTTGVALGMHRSGARVRGDLAVFWERHHPVSLGTDFNLVGLLRDDTVATVLAADPVRLSGARGALRWFAGVDPNSLILTGELLGEVTAGDAAYRRTALTLSASHPLPLGFSGAMEVGGGAAWGDLPLQRSFFLGGSRTLRGFGETAAWGDAFWRGRAEVATGFAGARLAAFTDAGWAGPREAFGLRDPLVSVGIGASLLDGVVRLDVARGVRRGAGWRSHLYLDGLF